MSSYNWSLNGLPLQAGPRTVADGSSSQMRGDNTGAAVVTDGHGRFYEATKRGRTFICMNSAAQALSLTGTTTYTGMVVYNPAGSGVNFAIQTAMYLQTVLSTGLGGVMLFTQPLALTTPTLTATNTSGSPFSALIGAGQASAAKVASSCTLAANPTFLRPLISIPWITAVSQTGGVFKDQIDGEIVVPPGGAIGFVAITTALSGLAYLSWEEVTTP